MWNDEIKQNIINELNEKFDSINPINVAENHSYADSIFSPDTSNMFKPMSKDAFEVPNYFETMISKTRSIKEVPVHTIAFADSFETKQASTIGFAYAPSLTSNYISNNDTGQVCDMETIIHSSSAITIPLTPEQRGVAISKRTSWRNIFFEDASLIKNTSFAEAIRKFCSIQIKF